MKRQSGSSPIGEHLSISSTARVHSVGVLSLAFSYLRGVVRWQVRPSMKYPQVFQGSVAPRCPGMHSPMLAPIRIKNVLRIDADIE